MKNSIDIGDKFTVVGEGRTLEVVSLSNGAYGGLVWLSWPTSGRQLNRGIEAYLRDDLDKLLVEDVIRKID